MKRTAAALAALLLLGLCLSACGGDDSSAEGTAGDSESTSSEATSSPDDSAQDAGEAEAPENANADNSVGAGLEEDWPPGVWLPQEIDESTVKSEVTVSSGQYTLTLSALVGMSMDDMIAALHQVYGPPALETPSVPSGKVLEIRNALDGHVAWYRVAPVTEAQSSITLSVYPN